MSFSLASEEALSADPNDDVSLYDQSEGQKDAEPSRSRKRARAPREDSDDDSVGNEEDEQATAARPKKLKEDQAQVAEDDDTAVVPNDREANSPVANSPAVPEDPSGGRDAESNNGSGPECVTPEVTAFSTTMGMLSTDAAGQGGVSSPTSFSSPIQRRRRHPAGNVSNNDTPTDGTAGWDWVADRVSPLDADPLLPSSASDFTEEDSPSRNSLEDEVIRYITDSENEDSDDDGCRERSPRISSARRHLDFDPYVSHHVPSALDREE